MLRRTLEKNRERTISGLGPIFFPPKLQEVALDLVRKMFFREALPLFLLTIRSTRPVDSLSTFHPAGSPVTYHDLSTDVVWACAIPDKGGQNVVEPLPSALHRLWPARFASPTAARKACRRREIFVQNVCLGSCSTLVFPGDVVEQRQRSAPDLPVKSARGIAAQLPRWCGLCDRVRGAIPVGHTESDSSSEMHIVSSAYNTSSNMAPIFCYPLTVHVDWYLDECHGTLLSLL